MTVYEYVYCEDKELTEDFRDHIFENAFDEYVRHLPTTPITEHGRKNPVWTDGSEILCESEVLAKTIADMLDYITGECESHYHYYDPEEDERGGCVDDHTGWWYVDFD